MASAVLVEPPRLAVGLVIPAPSAAFFKAKSGLLRLLISPNFQCQKPSAQASSRVFELSQRQDSTLLQRLVFQADLAGPPSLFHTLTFRSEEVASLIPVVSFCTPFIPKGSANFGSGGERAATAILAHPGARWEPIRNGGVSYGPTSSATAGFLHL